jgi:DNA invertase Pin-like site-specific DNA recombinase
VKVANRKTASVEAVAYYRTSTDDQLLGIDAQHSTVAHVANQKGLPIIRTWTEHESGGDSERPALRQALRFAKRTGATLIVAKLDRLARDSAFLMKLADGDVPVIFGDMPNSDGSAAGRLQIQMMSNFAEFERTRIGERTKEALAVLKARGVKLGAARPECRNLTDSARKLGAVNSAKAGRARAIEDMQEEAEIATRMRKDGATLQSIADYFNADNRPTRNNGKWNPMTVARVIKRAAGK